jgi:SAM-dependent methyltransferase
MDAWQPRTLPDAEVRRIVADGYDAMGERFDRWADQAVGSPRAAFASAFAERLPPSGAVLEIGCGSGARVTSELADRFAITGIDLSARQIERARVRLPSATFLVADALTVDLPAASFDGVIALYMVNHLPSASLGRFYERVAGWLVPHGVFAANLPVSEAGDGIEASYLGVPMFFGSLSAGENLALIRAAGLSVIEARLITEIEVDEDGSSSEGTWQWVVARRGDEPSPAQERS